MPKITVPAAATGLPASPPSEITHAPADFTRWPQVYALRLKGDCMAPVLKDNDVLVLDKEAAPKAGDLVGIWMNETTRDGQPVLLCQTKRLSMDVMPGITFPTKMGGDIMPLVCFEQINPPRYYSLRCDKLLGLHKIVGVQRSNGRIDKTSLKRNAALLEAERAAPAALDMVPGWSVQ